MANSNRSRRGRREGADRGGSGSGGGRGDRTRPRNGGGGGSGRGGDGYQPDTADNRRQSQPQYPPPSRHPLPPYPTSKRPRRPSPSPPRSPAQANRNGSRMFQFGDNYRPGNPSPKGVQGGGRGPAQQPHRDDDRRSHFSFRSQVDAPHFPQSHSQSHQTPRHPRQSRRGDHHQRNKFSGDSRPRQRPRYQPVPTYNRPIIRALAGSGDRTPERLSGMVDGPDRFKISEDFSDSQTEADMDMSASEHSSGNLPDKKRVKLATDAEASAVPKWSNPDPYTALPPPDESRVKKRDVVKLIRKSKVATILPSASQNAIAENADFVSFDFASDQDDDEDQSTTSTNQPQHNDYQSRYGGAQNGRPQKSLKRKRQDDEGDVIPAWIASSQAVATPWNQADHSVTQLMGLWLHKEICDFYEFVRPRDFEQRIREDLVDRISSTLRQRFPQGRVYCFGSFAAGLYLPTADMDVAFVSEQFERSGHPQFRIAFGWMKQVLHTLERAGIASYEGSTIVAKARVPIIKFVDRMTGLKVDVSFENMSGVIANKTFEEWIAQFPAMPKLVSLIKQFLLMRNLNEVVDGGIGGFSISCLVVSLLQHHPAIQSGSMVQEQHLGELLLDFFDLYGNKFNMATTAIRMKPPGYIPKFEERNNDGPRKLKPDRWTIMDPNKADNDVSGGSSKAPLIAKLFSTAFRTLQEHMALLDSSNISTRRGQSILGCLLGGNYESFADQRSHMWSIHERSR